MRVIIPFSYYHPETCAGIYIVDDLMHALAEQGHEAVLYVPTPTRNVQPGSKWERDEYICGGKVHIHRFRMFGEGRNPLLRALRYLLCECYYLHRMLWDKYDVAFIDSTPPIQGLKLPIVRLFRRKPVVYNVQDLFPETLSGTGLAEKGGLLWKIGCWVANVTFRNSDRIIAISHDISRSLAGRGVPASKVEVVYNWVDSRAVVPVPDCDNPLFEQYGIPRDSFRVVYAGNLGNAQNVSIMLDAAAQLPDVQFVIFGTGGLENELRERQQKEELSNVSILPLQPFDRVSYVYCLGSVCVVACKPGLGGAAMPSKTWSIMSAGRAVLASFDEGELKHILMDNGLGAFTAAGDADAFAAAIRRLSNEPAICAVMGAAGRRFIEEQLSMKAGTDRYIEIIKSTIKQ